MATSTLLSWEQFEQLPARPGKDELLNGELLELPPAKWRHHDIAEAFYDLLKPAVVAAHGRGEAPRLGRVHLEMGYRLGPRTWLAPDVSLTHAGQAANDYMEGAPAIAIEIVSPANTPAKLARKTALYFEHGALEVWRLYDDDDPRIEVFTPQAADPAVHRDVISTPLLPGFVLNLADLLRR